MKFLRGGGVSRPDFGAFRRDLRWPGRCETKVMLIRKPLPHSEVTESVIEGFHDVVHELGTGFSEKVSKTALTIVLQEKGMHVWENAPLSVSFRGRTIGTFFADMVVNDVVLIEIKAIPSVDNRAIAQILNYLKAAGGGVGLLLNFGSRPDFKRFVMGDPASSLPNLIRISSDSTETRVELC